jgi:AraC-like DNA-binding protein
VYLVRDDASIRKVEDILHRTGTTKRSLQRLFEQYVGASPKWVIQRYRLHEAAERLKAGSVSGSRLALELGYADQAHFIRDFKAIVGISPGAYARRARTSA